MATRQQMMLTAAQDYHSPSVVGSLQFRHAAHSFSSPMALQGAPGDNVNNQGSLNINEANAFLQQMAMPKQTNQQSAMLAGTRERRSPSNVGSMPGARAEIQLTSLDDDIANCEEQLAILQRMKELRAMQLRLNQGASGPRGVDPSSLN
mmetsp:Transcript_33791/g.72032  ORF Transcript_33791/g.72032 Transcript_33791/m.72032 type:complete len:149 (-) Transcript_33791:47-493(-)